MWRCISAHCIDGGVEDGRAWEQCVNGARTVWTERQYETAALLAERERQTAIDRRKNEARRVAVGGGDCSDCGEPIPLARRKAFPAAVRCLDCQIEFENQGVSGR